MSFFKEILSKLFNWGTIGLGELTSQNDNIKTIKINPLTLSFPEPFESTFLSHYTISSKGKINAALIVGAIFYSCFFFLDYFLVPEYFINFLIVRFIGTWIIVGSTLFYNNWGKNNKLNQLFVSLTAIFVIITIIYYIVLAYPKLNNSYYVGIIIVYYWTYSFLRLRFIWAAFTGILTFLIYQIVVLTVIDLGNETYVITTSFLLGTNFVGMIISYSLEYYSRKDYFQTLQLKESLKANISLNKKINETDKAINEAERKLVLQSQALESAANGIMIIKNDGNIIWCNSAIEKLTGYTPYELIGKNPRLLTSGKHDKIFYKNLWSTVKNGHVWSGEIINKKKSGEIYYEDMIITPVMSNESKEISHFIAIKQDITLRKKMEEELFESEKRLRGLFENATLGIYRSSPSGEILMANNALIKMLGFNYFEELVNRDTNCVGYLKPDQREIFIRMLKSNGTLVGFESQWVKPDGSIICIRESARVDYESGKEIFEGTVEDISLSKFAEKQLLESKERLQAIFDNVYHAIFIHDVYGNVVEVNKKVLEFYNLTIDEALKITIKEISRDDMPFDVVGKQWQEVVNDGKTFLFEWKAMRPKDKSIFDVEVFLSRITLGEKKFVLANVRNITAQKAAHRNLLFTQKAVDLNATPVIWISKESEIIYANNAASEQLGYSYNELLFMSIQDINPTWTNDYWINVGYKILKEKGSYNFETTQKRKNGEEYPVEVISTIISFENEDVVIANVIDISERKKAAAALIEAKEKAEQSDKFKSEFLAGMSHEIRTPVNTILNFISLIKADLGENVTEDISSSFEMIDSGSRRLIRTIDSIINMSQLHAGAYDLNVELFSLQDDVISPLSQEFKQPAVRKKIDFLCEVKTEESFVLADHYTIMQVLVNLIDNAIKYTKEGSVKVSLESDDNFFIINVEDTGIGISQEFLPILFEPFLQEEMGYTRTFEGNGLGLALVKNYIELNNASIEVKSKKGMGSTFTVKISKPTIEELEKFNKSNRLTNY